MKPLAAPALSLTLLLAGCGHLPGRPKPGIEVPTPQSVLSFNTLYNQNCSACHGPNGRNGPAIDLGNPIYQAWVDDASLRNIVANGETGTQMPAFARSAGGFLTDAQVDALVHGMRASWQKPGALGGQTPPPYQGKLTGDAAHGQQLYQTACARCHNSTNQSITYPAYLALVDDQTLRAIIVAGRPDLGHPDWRGDIPGRPLTDQEVTDIVAWLASQRNSTPGQPYASPQ
jgi:cytochrome c oxidase cbb3-type subunit 3